MGNAQKKDIESQLLGDEIEPKRISVQELEAALAMEVSDEETLFFNEDGTVGRNAKTTKKLEKAEAMAFLNLPTRKHNVMRKGDLSLIRWKFKGLFEKWILENQPGRNEDKLFWDQMRVRVINKKQAGLPTRGCPSAGIAPGVYSGDILTGEAVKAFLPETRFSNAGDDYIVQLLSMTVTEELESV